MTTDHTFQIVPISAGDAQRLREAGGEVYLVDAVPGYPCRQCLQDAQIGEELILVSYDPFGSDSPYRSASPIFLHRVECAPPDRGGGIGPYSATGCDRSGGLSDRKRGMHHVPFRVVGYASQPSVQVMIW
ncbi:MAG: DUF1203 domain-containing protein [Actinomycetia bacterium]|nr:DUF1203 domain-containing protein [Actinomycetes bacterium]